jgi:hypothetical protein
MTNEVKKEIAEAAVKLAEYVHNNNFEGIIVSGGSNQLSRSLLTLAWQNRFKDQKMPHIYIFDRKTNTRMYKVDLPVKTLMPEIKQWISDNLPELGKIADRNLCYVDDFSLSGEKFVSLRRMFKELEFNNLKFAFFAAASITELSEDTFVGTRDLDTVGELQTLSLEIQGDPKYKDILAEVEATAEERRHEALSALKEIGQQIRMK